MYRPASRTHSIFGNTLFALLTAVMLASALLLAGCGTDAAEVAEPQPEEPAASGSAPFPVTLTDDAGRTVTIEAEPQRIVSLAPANTEIVAALGSLDRVVGVTSFDDYPPEVTGIAVVGDFVGPNLEAVAAAEPDIILATTGVQADVIVQLEDLGATVLAVDPAGLEELFASIDMVGAALGAADEATLVLSEMRAALDGIEFALSGSEPVTCFLEIAQDPLFTAGPGTLLDDLIVAAGGRNVVTQEGYVGYSLEQLVTDDPEVYLATLGSMSDPADLAARPGYADLSAVRSGRVHVLEDNLVSRPGPRIVEGVRLIAEALHPEAF